MKKTFRFLSMAALLVVSAIMTGCSSDDNIDNPQQPANKDNVVTLTATVSLDGAAGTRAINPTSGVKTFESTNKIAVFYQDVDDKIQKAESGALTLSADKKKATFTVTLSNPKSGGSFRYVYPATMAKALDATPPAYPALVDALEDLTIDYSGLLGSQDGTLETIGTKYDLAVFDGSLAVTELPDWAGMENPLAICKFTLKKDGSSAITSIVNSLTISDGTNAYAVTPSGLDAIYVAMKPASGNIAFTARTTDSKTYFKTATGTSLVASKLYTNITVGSMVELAKGNVIGYDGKIYASKTAAGSNAAAVIVYLGDNTYDATFKNGLAIALADEGAMEWSPAKSTCEGKTAITGAKWCLPSQNQWKQMFKANGDNDASYTGLNTTITTAGGTTLQEGVSYWSSSEIEINPGDDAYYGVNLIGSNASASWSPDNEASDNRVRACLAF